MLFLVVQFWWRGQSIVKVLASIATAVIFSNAICVAADAAEILTKPEIEAEIVGHEFRGRSGDGNILWIDVSDSGTFYGSYRNVKISGKYRITEDGQWCRRIGSAPEQCLNVYRREGGYDFRFQDGSLSSSMERQ